MNAPSIKDKTAKIVFQSARPLPVEFRTILSSLDPFGRKRREHHTGRLSAFATICPRKKLVAIQDERPCFPVIFWDDVFPVFSCIVDLLFEPFHDVALFRFVPQGVDRDLSFMHGDKLALGLEYNG
jgi:hypothetical protein